MPPADRSPDAGTLRRDPRPRVGLLSIPRYYNHGSQLQLFALQSAVEDGGYRCEVLDYVKEGPPPAPLGRRIRSLMGRPHRLPAGLLTRGYDAWLALRERGGLDRARAFEAEFLKLTGPRYRRPDDFFDTPPDHDAFVVGSDQLWSPLGHLGDRAFFLGFAPRGRRISYAPSVGVSEVGPEAASWLAAGVLEIDHLSVREDTGARLLERVSGRRAAVVADPTLLLAPDRWEAVARAPEAAGPYVLMYALCGDAYVRRRAREVARRLGCRLVVLPKHPRDVLDPRPGVDKAWNVGPREFLGLIHGARAVVTDSFHGTVFSVRFGRPFYSFRRYDDPIQSATFSRIADFLGHVGLQGRIMDRTMEWPAKELEIDFADPHRRLDAWIERSRGWLHRALAEATSGIHPVAAPAWAGAGGASPLAPAVAAIRPTRIRARSGSAPSGD